MPASQSLVFLPGTMNDARLWSRLLPLLPATYQISHVPLHTARTRDDMQQMIAAACAPDSHLIGFSMGGYLALEYAINHPQQLRSLSVIASSAQGLRQQELKLRSDMLQWLQSHDYHGMARQRLHTLIHADHWQDEAMLNLVRQMDRDLGKSVLMTQLRETSLRNNLLPTLKQLDYPVLVIGASDDQLISTTDLQAMHHALQQSELTILQHSGHLIPLEQPALLAQTLIHFFARY